MLMRLPHTMKDTDFKSAQRAYDNLLPESFERKVACKQCMEHVWESDLADIKSGICHWCEDENSLKEFEKDLDQYTMKEHK